VVAAGEEQQGHRAGGLDVKADHSDAHGAQAGAGVSGCGEGGGHGNQDALAGRCQEGVFDVCQLHAVRICIGGTCAQTCSRCQCLVFWQRCVGVRQLFRMRS